MEISELKKAVHKDLTVNKEKERLARVKENKKLTKITLYTHENNPMCKNFKKHFTQEGIKFKEKNLNDHKSVLTTVQLNNVPIIFINKNYLVQGRDFQNAQQAVGAIKHFADPNFVNPPFEDRLIESIKNLNMNIGKNIMGLNRQLQPIVKIMNELAKEDNEEKNN